MTVEEQEQPARWEDLGWGPWPETGTMPQEDLDAATREAQGLPSSLTVAHGDGILQRPVFDPALQQYAKAMRAGEPQFVSPDTAERWHAARRRALDHALAAVAGSRWAPHLVARGSVLLKAWYGDAAREPGDLDFVVAPVTWRMEEPRTERMLDDIAAATAELARADGAVRIDAAEAVRDEIWTYDRVPGRRLVLPWHAEGLPSGNVQLDFVFNEELPAAAEFTDVPRRSGAGAPHRVLAATAELSLAWKLLWLVTDYHPQVKDLYDAVLLAESTPLGARLLLRTLAAAESEWAGKRFEAAHVTHIEADDFEFAKEYPDIPDTVEELRGRLVAALAPTIEECAAIPSADGYTWRVGLLAPRIAAARQLAQEQGLDAVHRLIGEQGLAITEAVVVVREVLGAERCSIADAAATFMEHQIRTSASWGYYRRNPKAGEKAVWKLAEEV